jgi:hypothetical protein
VAGNHSVSLALHFIVMHEIVRNERVKGPVQRIAGRTCRARVGLGCLGSQDFHARYREVRKVVVVDDRAKRRIDQHPAGAGLPGIGASADALQPQPGDPHIVTANLEDRLARSVFLMQQRSVESAAPAAANRDAAGNLQGLQS